MRTRNPLAAPPRYIRRPPVFASPDEIHVGMLVFDRDYDMPGKVRNVDGKFIEIERPTGYVWRQNYLRLRRATEREERQLDAIRRLHAVRQRGL
ncbi:hypothetical protein ACWGCW_19765 [Streptomyces sp. NPDC054933]